MKSKTTAALLALFLGFLGVHRFYLKQFWLGILYLITLGFYGIGALIDFIMFITMRDERFDEKYNSKYLSYQEKYSEPIITNVIQKVEEPIKITTLPNVENDFVAPKVFDESKTITENKPHRVNTPLFQMNEKNVKGIFGLIFIIGFFWFWLGGGIWTVAEHNMKKAENIVAKDVEKQYYIVKRMGTPMEIYVHAGFVKAAYLQLGDDDNYKKWAKIEKEEARKAGMPIFE